MDVDGNTQTVHFLSSERYQLCLDLVSLCESSFTNHQSTSVTPLDCRRPTSEEVLTGFTTSSSVRNKAPRNRLPIPSLCFGHSVQRSSGGDYTLETRSRGTTQASRKQVRIPCQTTEGVGCGLRGKGKGPNRRTSRVGRREGLLFPKRQFIKNKVTVLSINPRFKIILAKVISFKVGDETFVM